MQACRGWIVRSTAGRDKDTLLCVLGQEGDYFLLADGKRRKASSPKRKKTGHVDMVCRGTFRHPAIRKLEDGLTVSDSELRRALGAFRHQGGN
ncbi:KOW domain-containing RNA-binding protein [Intestinimonas sp. HCP28S3_D6]|uniref:KOW domain-containing RNA-binding protein n=1 Tax=Intestinimonas sp. HCP28S3_D6 TaxID=3438942 RepID=UPI003F88CE06